MTKTELKLELADLNCPLLSAGLMTVLRTAELSRPRRVQRSLMAKQLRSFGYKSPLNAGSWRDLARRFLRRALPGCTIYVGGHHVAIHAAGPVTAAGQMPPCLARIVETRPV